MVFEESESALITDHRAGFGLGFTPITSVRAAGKACGSGLELGVLRLAEKQKIRISDERECAWVLLSGNVRATVGDLNLRLSRASLFDEGPSTVHLSSGGTLELEAELGGAELIVAKTENSKKFPAQLFLPEQVQTEYRGRGLAQEACLRQVRQIFDLKSRPDSQLVLGEVINYPGRWSSYPPHHHEQPELYHYRFTEPQGYGHAELGERVFKIKDRDTLRIPGGMDHAQVSAPGYGMYYLWVVKHLPDKPYVGFEFTEEHRWLLDHKKQGWKPRMEAPER